jgi:hypothetical protein
MPAGQAGGGRSQQLQLARVTGAMDSPKVTLTRQAVVDFATKVAGPGKKYRDKVEEQADKYLPPGLGGELLDSILGGRGKR